MIRSALNLPQEKAIRAFHDELPTREHRWALQLEGSYALLDDLLDPARVGREWLFVDRGHREMQYDTHGNDLVHRWVLGRHGITVSGPPASDVVAVITADALRAEARHELAVLREGLMSWVDLDIAAFQRYLVVNYCRVLFTILTGEVASKRAALDWAIGALDPRWRALLVAARDERVRGWDVTDRPGPGVVEESLAFAGYCEQWTP